ncbi:MAG TPA: hypothetical protein VG937_13540 [Polyangiaceae bacterium]|nr:hypothetical protein [Polyangiaceae bacterium]
MASVTYNWRNVIIQGGGFVTGLLFSPVKAGIFYARTDVGGAYRYDTATRSWIPLTDWVSRKDGSYMGIESIAPDPVNADRVYMAIGMYAQTWAGPGAFARSDDQGKTWKLTPMASLKMGGNDLGRSNGERLAVDPNQPKILLFGSRLSGMWISKDESDSWNKLESFPVKDDPKGLGIPFVIFDPASGKSGEPSKIIYAGVNRFEDNLYRSTDGGGTWQLVPKQPKGFMPSRAALDKDGMLYVTYGNDPGPFAVQNGALYRLDTKKDVWTDISPLKPSKEDGFGYGGVSVDAQHPGTLITSSIDRWSKGGEIWRSTDSGKTWKPVLSKATFESPGVVHTYHHREKLDAPQWMGDVKIDPFASGHAATVDGGGIWTTDDLTKADKNEPTRWFFDVKNLEETCIRGLISPPEGAPLLSVMGDLCGFRHDSLDESPKRGNFQNPVCASADSIDFAGKKPSVMARVGTWSWDDKNKTPRGGVSADGGATWTQFGSEPAGSNGQGSVAVSADGAVILWGARDARTSRSLDRGATWVAVKGLPDPVKVPDWSQTSLRLAADKVNPKIFYAFDAMEGKSYASEDGGATFTLTTGVINSLPEYNLVVASIQPVLGMEGHVWVTAGKELYQSTDFGKSYAAVGNVEESYAVGFGAPAPGQKYPAAYLSGKVGGVTGFFRSDDGGANFVRINDDQHQFGGSNVITGDARVYGRVYVGPGGRGILVGEPAAK